MAQRVMKNNPAFLTEEELIQCFVVRNAELQLVVDTVRENAGDANQHLLVVGPRGMGKTMLVLRAAAEVRRHETLSKRWYPLVFGEESYAVTTPGEFWLEALFHLWHQTKDDRWRRTYEDLRGESAEERLRERALAQLMDFADSLGKRILLVVENLNMLLGEQMADDDAWVLRHTLQHEPRVMMLASATTRSEAFDNSGKAMFEMFRPLQLRPLDEEDCRKVWAAFVGEAPPVRQIRPIKILTGGSPRLLAIISSFAAGRSFGELMQDLTQLVDDHTEYFKTHLEGLPPTERKVYLALAEIWEPATARSVAAAARLEVSATSALLKRLVGRGAVEVSDERQRTKYYKVAERLYNIYYLMRRRGTPSDRVKAVVDFMIHFYGEEDLARLTRSIAEEATHLDTCSRESHYYACESILRLTPDRIRANILREIPRDFLESPDAPSSLRELAAAQDSLLSAAQNERSSPVQAWKVAEVPPEAEGQRVSDLCKRAEALERKGQLGEAEENYRRAADLAPADAHIWENLGVVLLRLGRSDESETALRRALELKPTNALVWGKLGASLSVLGRYVEAEQAYRKGLELAPELALMWVGMGVVLQEGLSRYNEAEQAYHKGVELDPVNVLAWQGLGRLLHENLARYDEAEVAYRKAIELKPEDAWAWAELGQLLHENLERYAEAEAAYRKAIELEPDYAFAWAKLGQLLHDNLARYDEAEVAYRKAIEFRPEHPWPWLRLGLLLHDHLKRYGESEEAYRKAIEFGPDSAQARTHLGRLLGNLRRFDEAEEAYRKAIEINPGSGEAWCLLGILLHVALERYAEAEQAYRKAIELNPEVAWTWMSLGSLLHEKSDRYAEAEAAYRKAIELDPKLDLAWLRLVALLVEQDDRGEEAIQMAEECIKACLEDGGLLNELAWTFYVARNAVGLRRAEAWAREAVRLQPDEATVHHTLACILCAVDKGEEALGSAEKYFSNAELVAKSVDDAIELGVALGSAGVARQAITILQQSPGAPHLEPLIVGLKLFVGDDVKAPQEILEVGKDVAQRIRDRQARESAPKEPVAANGEAAALQAGCARP